MFYSFIHSSDVDVMPTRIASVINLSHATLKVDILVERVTS